MYGCSIFSTYRTPIRSVDYIHFRSSNCTHTKIAIFMHRFHSSELPVTFNSMFQLNTSIHKYPTRTCTNVHLNNPKTALAHRSIRHTGPDIWNSLPIDIRSSPTKFILKKRLKNYLLSHIASGGWLTPFPTA